MKPTITPRNVEKVLPDNSYIVSKTDLKGRITYANPIFMEMAGYTENELLDVQHNIIRHPDMPRGAFKLLWDTISQGNEFFAYVINLAKDGSYYWVFANITPDRDPQGNITGYLSVRRKPRAEAIEAVKPIYKAMVDLERKHGTNDGMNHSIQFLLDALAQQGVSYEEFILSI